MANKTIYVTGHRNPDSDSICSALALAELKRLQGEKITVGDKFLNMFFAQFKDENDRPSGIMVLIQDITEHVKLDNMRKEFVADVSHELKTPLTSILGYAETLSETDYDDEIRQKFLGVISEYFYLFIFNKQIKFVLGKVECL